MWLAKSEVLVAPLDLVRVQKFVENVVNGVGGSCSGEEDADEQLLHAGEREGHQDVELAVVQKRFDEVAQVVAFALDVGVRVQRVVSLFVVSQG